MMKHQVSCFFLTQSVVVTDIAGFLTLG